MKYHYSKKFPLLALLFFFSALSLPAARPFSAAINVDGARQYLSALFSASMDFEGKFPDSLGLSYANTRQGDPGNAFKSWEAGLRADKSGKTFSGGLSLKFGGDDLSRSSLGARLSGAALWEYAPGFDASLGLSGGYARFSAAQSSSSTTGILQKRSYAVDHRFQITQWSPSADLTLGFFNACYAWGTLTRYRYQDYAAGSGLAGSPERDQAAAQLANTLVSGFRDWQWSVGAGVMLPKDLTLSGSYTESLELESQIWVKSLSGSLSQRYGKTLKVSGGITHATESGSGDNTFSAGLNFYF